MYTCEKVMQRLWKRCENAPGQVKAGLLQGTREFIASKVSSLNHGLSFPDAQKATLEIYGQGSLTTHHTSSRTRPRSRTALF